MRERLGMVARGGFWSSNLVPADIARVLEALSSLEKRAEELEREKNEALQLAEGPSTLIELARGAVERGFRIVALEKERDSLRSSLAWQPIETAPKDGTKILVCISHNLPDGGWETIQWVDWQKPPFVWPIYRERIDIPFPPTHWMPLPESP